MLQPVLGIDAWRRRAAWPRELDPLEAPAPGRARVAAPGGERRRSRRRPRGPPRRAAASASRRPRSRAAATSAARPRRGAAPSRSCARRRRPAASACFSFSRASFFVTVFCASPSPKTPRGSSISSLVHRGHLVVEDPRPLGRLGEEAGEVASRHLAHDGVEVVARRDAGSGSARGRCASPARASPARRAPRACAA